MCQCTAECVDLYNTERTISLAFGVIIGVIAILLTKGRIITPKGGERIISGIWCNFNATGNVQNNMDTMNRIYTQTIGYISKNIHRV